MGVNMNKPVAWMYEKSNGASKLSFVKEKMIWEDMIETPLYTHPAKTLTNEEIHEIAEYHGIDSLYKTGRLDFARAILRKAQDGH
jgi:hypothetical protein